MNEGEFSKLVDNICELTPAQHETLFAKLWEHFRYCGDKSMSTDQVAWRCKQALMLIQHRKTIKPYP